MKLNLNKNPFKSCKACVHCKTYREAIKFLKYLDSIGKFWRSGDRYTDHSNWNTYKENTVYYFNEGCFGNIYEVKKEDYLVLEYSEIAKENPYSKYME